MTTTSGLEVRPVARDDEEPVHRLLADAMREGVDDDRRRPFLRWKHEESPFGPSPAWVAVIDGELAGYRAFLRWRFRGLGGSWSAVRAVDTATHPRFQGRGVFRALTLHALDALEADGVDFVFNTPNDQSRPGYLSMGWRDVGRLQPWITVRSPVSLLRLARARVPAGTWGEPTTAGRPAAEVLADDAVILELLASSPLDELGPLRTDRSLPYLRWRYGNELLGYRAQSLGTDPREGIACFRVRRRGTALEATVGDVLVPGDDRAGRRALLHRIVRATGADYAIQLGPTRPPGTLPLPRQGPRLVWREVRATEPPPRRDWHLSMGDIELF